MSVPVTKVEFGFTQSAGAYVYSDVTSYVRTVEINRGRANNFDAFDAGSASILLSNLNREFDPSYLTPVTNRTNLVKNPIPSTSAPSSPQETWQMLNRGTGGAGTTTLTSDGALDTVTTAASTVVYSFGITGGTTAARIPVTAGLLYTFSMYVTSSVNDVRRLAATFYDAGGTSLGDVAIGSSTTLTAGIEARLTGSYTAPAGAVSCRIYGGNVTGSVIRPLGSTMYWRHALVEQASTVGDYFDGSDADTANVTNSWSGTAQASSSLQAVIPSLFGAEVRPQAAVRITSGNVVIFQGWVDSYFFDYQVSSDATVTFNCLDGIARLSVAELNAHTPSAEKTDVRIANVLNRSEVNWSATARDIDAGVITVGTTPVEQGISAWDYLSQVSDSEGGAIYIAADGDVTFKSQREPISDLTVYTYRYNQCVLPSFESSTTTVGNASWTIGGRTSTYAKYRTYSATEATFTDPYEGVSGGSVTGHLFYDRTPNRWVQNQTYTISLWVYQSDINYSDVYLFAGSGIIGAGFLKDVVSDYASLRGPDGWVRLSVEFTPTRANQPLSVWTSRSSGTLYADALLIEPSIYLGEYFDGTTKPSNTSTVTYFSSWTGTADVSSSTLEIQTEYSGESPNATYFDDTNTNIPFTAVQLAYGSELNYNRVVVVNTAGTVTAVDSASGTAYGIRTFTQPDNLSNNLADGTAVANYLLDSYRLPDYRFQSISTELSGLEPLNQYEVLITDVWDAADITYTPSAVGTALHSIEKVVGVAHSISPDSHQVTFALSSYGSRFVLDSTTQGVLDMSRLGSP
jgi:hypothetical protein